MAASVFHITVEDNLSNPIVGTTVNIYPPTGPQNHTTLVASAVTDIVGLINVTLNNAAAFSFTTTSTILPNGSFTTYTPPAGQDGYLILIAQPNNTGVCPPIPPSIIAIKQAPGMVHATIATAQVTGDYPIASLQLYRSQTQSGTYSLISSRPVSQLALWNVLYDFAPVYGQQAWYQATSTDVSGQVSTPSFATPYTALLTNSFGQVSTISPAALGPYPVLGSDLYIQPDTGEGVIGPNGDFVTVNGLGCLAQDLRIRFMTRIGELLLHPTFGLNLEGLIGAGQSSPVTQAQILRQRITDVLTQDARVLDVLGVSVTQIAFDSWLLSYTIRAIGVEDPQQLNLVWPYYSQPAQAALSA